MTSDNSSEQLIAIGRKKKFNQIDLQQFLDKLQKLKEELNKLLVSIPLTEGNIIRFDSFDQLTGD